jgi:DNA polymerase-3 subunit alpha
MKFVGLHGHDTLSIGDGFNYPEEHFKFVVENAGEESMAMAITNHGNLNSLGYVLQAQASLKKKGINFHAIIGNEMYIHPDLEQWKKDKIEIDALKKSIKVESLEEESVVENESETKDRSKWLDPVKRRHHLVVLACNNKGLENLFKLTSWSYQHGFYRFPRVDFAQLRKYNEGLIISSACLGGLPSFLTLREFQKGDEAVFKAFDNELKPLLDIFGKDRAYLELQFNSIPEQKIVNEYLVKYSERTGYKLISTADSHYARPEFWKEREIYKKLAHQTKGWAVDKILPQSVDELKCELYPKNGDQMYAAYLKYNPELDAETVRNSITRTYDIAHGMIESIKPNSVFKLPKISQKEPSEELKEICFEELKKRGFDKNKKYIDRLNYELSVIGPKNYSEYFIVLKKAMDEIQKHQLVGCGRGSAAGSLVNYLLNVTKVDPVKHDLLFERFLSENRQDAPDADNDTSSREETMRILRETFGEEKVVAISNFNTLQLKSLVKDVSRFYDIPFFEVNEVTMKMEDEAKPFLMEEIGFDQKLYSFDYDGALKYSPSFAAFVQKYPEINKNIKLLFKQVKAVAKHAGGVALLPEAEKHMPLIKIRGQLQTPWSEGLTAKHLEQFGIIKYDFLALATLRVFEDCIRNILLKTKKTVNFSDIKNFYDKHLHPDVVGQGDIKVFKNIYHTYDYNNIFQFTEKAVQSLARKAKPKCIDDISAITSIFRPGPLHGKADEKYLEFENSTNIKYDHPVLEDVLGSTRGLLIYQEQFMLLANKLAGMTLIEADDLRKLLVKPVTSLGDELKKKRIEAGEKFIEGSISNGLSRERAKRLWNEEILGFVSYGFNRSHAIAYSYISYSCAWLWYYYPNEWMCAVLENEASKGDIEKQEAMAFAKSQGFSILMPDINKSKDKWAVIDDKIIAAPLTIIKSLNEKSIIDIIMNQPYNNIDDLLFNEKINYTALNKRCLDVLSKSGALDSLIDERFENDHHFNECIVNYKNDTKTKKAYKTFNVYVESRRGEFLKFSREEKLLNIMSLTGFYDISKILNKTISKHLKEENVPCLSELKDIAGDGNCWFILRNFELTTSKAGKQYYKFFCIDSTYTEIKVYVFGLTSAPLVNSCYLANISKFDNNIGFIWSGDSNLARIA